MQLKKLAEVCASCRLVPDSCILVGACILDAMPLGSLEFGLLLMDAEWRKDAGTEVDASAVICL